MKFRDTIKTNLPNLSESEILHIIEVFTNISKNERCAKFKKYFKYQQNRFDINKVIECEKYRIGKNGFQLSYDIRYISLRDNISIEEAEKFVAEYKKKKTTSKEGFINRHGAELGEAKFNDFQKTSAIANKVKREIAKKEGKTWKKYNRENSKRCYEYYTTRDESITKEEAEDLACQFQLENSGVHKEYYTKRGYKAQEIQELFKFIHKKMGQNCRNKEHLRKKYGKKWKEHYRKYSEKYRKRMEELGYWTPLELLEEFNKYSRLCWLYTKENSYLVDKIDKRSIEWHLDHMYSIKQGFLDEVNPKIIGSIINLKIIPRSENCSKRANCSISLKELLENYENQKNN